MLYVKFSFLTFNCIIIIKSDVAVISFKTIIKKNLIILIILIQSYETIITIALIYLILGPKTTLSGVDLYFKNLLSYYLIFVFVFF